MRRAPHEKGIDPGNPPLTGIKPQIRSGKHAAATIACG
jgi:hypothetical protein